MVSRKDHQLAEVTSLHELRAHRGPVRTVILRASHIRTDAEAHRQLGIDDSLPLADLNDVLQVAFGLTDISPAAFLIDGHRLTPDTIISDVLGAPGQQIEFHWGLWQFRIEALDSWPRDAGTPAVLCVGGSGSFGGSDMDITGINAALTGEETITQTLGSAHPHVRDMLERCRIFDFIPLLQALDLRRETALPDETRRQLHTLPREGELDARDAFFAFALASASLADDDLVDDIVATTMASLGWVDDDGMELSAPTIRNMCWESVQVLNQLGAVGTERLPPAQRVDLYRELLREPHGSGVD